MEARKKTKRLYHQAANYHLQVLSHCSKFIKVSRTSFTSQVIINGNHQSNLDFIWKVLTE